jgi:hypothetical protein
MKRIADLFAAALFAVLIAFPIAAWSASKPHPLQDFFGKWAGRSVEVVGKGLSNRDYTLSIEPYEKRGFTLSWQTVIRYTNKKTKARSEKYDFQPYRPRPGLYFSAVKRDVFGHKGAADPISGDPYVWASVEGKTLLVSALYIEPDGGYELQTFERKLEEGHMSSHFQSIRDGSPFREITSSLERVSK